MSPLPIYVVGAAMALVTGTFAGFAADSLLWGVTAFFAVLSFAVIQFLVVVALTTNR